MKKFVSLVLALVLALSMTACGQTRGDDPAPVEDIPAEKVTIRLGGLKGPTSMGMVKLLADAEEGLTANDYTFTMAASAPVRRHKSGSTWAYRCPRSPAVRSYSKVNSPERPLSLPLTRGHSGRPGPDWCAERSRWH